MVLTWSHSKVLLHIPGCSLANWASRPYGLGTYRHLYVSYRLSNMFVLGRDENRLLGAEACSILNISSSPPNSAKPKYVSGLVCYALSIRSGAQSHPGTRRQEGQSQSSDRPLGRKEGEIIAESNCATLQENEWVLTHRLTDQSCLVVLFKCFECQHLWVAANNSKDLECNEWSSFSSWLKHLLAIAPFRWTRSALNFSSGLLLVLRSMGIAVSKQVASMTHWSRSSIVRVSWKENGGSCAASIATLCMQKLGNNHCLHFSRSEAVGVILKILAGTAKALFCRVPMQQTSRPLPLLHLACYRILGTAGGRKF